METKHKQRKRLFSHSIFLKLFLAMIGLGIVLLLTLGLFFNFFFGKTLKKSVELVIHNHSQQIVKDLGSTPSLEEAQQIAKVLNIELRYEGPDKSWTTSDTLPTVSEFKAMSGRPSIGHASLWRQYYVIQTPDGETFLLKWNFGWAASMHRELIIILLLLVGIVVSGAYFFLHRTLKPIKALQLGVKEITAGNLDVVVPQKTSDEIGALTESFNTMVQRIREMIHARDQLLVDVSHELRSPLTRMKVALEFIPESEKKHKLTQDVKEVETMITEILEIERLENGSAGLELKQLDLTDTLRESVQPFVKRGSPITLAEKQDRIDVKIDPNQIKIVLNNILENALKFSLPDSQPVEITVEQKNQTAIVNIKDDGQGIPEEDLPLIFEPFYRVDRSRSKKTGGYGLGLSMCKKIMEAHGGQIRCRNNPGTRGTTITLIFKSEFR